MIINKVTIYLFLIDIFIVNIFKFKGLKDFTITTKKAHYCEPLNLFLLNNIFK